MFSCITLKAGNKEVPRYIFMSNNKEDQSCFMFSKCMIRIIEWKLLVTSARRNLISKTLLEFHCLSNLADKRFCCWNRWPNQTDSSRWDRNVSSNWVERLPPIKKYTSSPIRKTLLLILWLPVEGPTNSSLWWLPNGCTPLLLGIELLLMSYRTWSGVSSKPIIYIRSNAIRRKIILWASNNEWCIGRSNGTGYITSSTSHGLGIL